MTVHLIESALNATTKSKVHSVLIPTNNTPEHLVLMPVFNLNAVWLVVVAFGGFSANLFCSVEFHRLKNIGINIRKKLG